MKKDFPTSRRLGAKGKNTSTSSDLSGSASLEKEFRSKNMPVDALDCALNEIRRLDALPPLSQEHSLSRNYLDWLGAIPWNKATRENDNLKKVKRQLDKDHTGLKDVKERILEHIAAYQLSRKKKAPALCFIGPPGIGKTSLGKSIAASLGRKFLRISLGGIRDETEIMGHRRATIGSMPGRIIQGLKKCGAMNPVFLLDEVDGLETNFKGDPAASLLEALDPDQNSQFSDHFMELGVDLSQVLFIITANAESGIPQTLRNKLEIIRISGYHLKEKIQIAQIHLIPKLITTSGINKKYFRPHDASLARIIRDYTHESGVRQLEKNLDKIARKIARQQLENPDKIRPLNETNLKYYLGTPHNKSRGLSKPIPGVITGLAWTPAGGEVLQVECKLLSGRGKMVTTGKLGDVMRESAQIATTLVRERMGRFKLDPELFRHTDIHLHLPEGAIPKDGPSAGLPITLALLSAFIRRSIHPSLAFTGEISLTGRIYGVGGMMEKCLAALQTGVKQIFVPLENADEVDALPKEVKSGLKIHTVDHIDKVIAVLFNRPA